jgi:poly-gamma-glutamate capsule biosynthesis protein CapA/YwtB (metallophosphatase superfamily)
MARQPAVPKRDPWFPWFILSLAALSGSLVALVVVLIDVSGEGTTNAASPPTTTTGDTPLPEVREGLTYSGDLPPGAETLELKPVAQGKTPDIEFAAGGDQSNPDSVVARYFVPVASVGAGVDALTLDQLSKLWGGQFDDWDDVGGVPGDVRVIVPSRDDLNVYGRLLGGAASGSNPQPEIVDGYGALRDEMTVDSGILAVVPLGELTPEMVAIAVDGIDIARGVGDAASWPPTLAESVSVVGRTKRGENEVEAIKANIAAKLPQVTRVVATGDVLQSRCSLAAIAATGDWGAALRGPVGEYLAAADLALSSLDGSIQGIGKPYGCIVMEYPNLTSPPEVIEALTLAGIDEMTLATNHAFDCGEGGCGSEALLESQSRLNAVGIKTVGGGHNLEEALAPAILEVNGLKFGILGFDDIAAEDLEATETEPGTAPLDDSYVNEKADLPAEPAFYKSADLLGVTRLQERIRALKQQVDVVIVQIQSGTEDTHAPSPRSVKALRAAADAGADLVVGNQAHWVQAAEVRGDAFLAYALGNFIFDQTHTPEHTQGYLLEATFHGKKLATVRLVPYQIEAKYKPTFVDGTTHAKIIGDVAEASSGLPE